MLEVEREMPIQKSEYHSSEADYLLAHERDCRCPLCEGDSPEESQPDRSEDNHLEAEYEDRVSGCDWNF